MDAGEETAPHSLSGDIEVQMYAAAAALKRLLAEGDYTGATMFLERVNGITNWLLLLQL